MSKNYNNNYQYGNREQRRQQQRQSKPQKTIIPNKFEVVQGDHELRTSLPQEDEDLTYFMEYKGEEYEIDGGYFTFLRVMEIEHNKEVRKANDRRLANQNKPNANPYTIAEEMLDFNETLKIAFADGEYERFMKNNRKISITEIGNVAQAISQLIATVYEESNFDEVSEEQTTFRK